MFKPKGPYCQSCSMPLSKDAGHGGSNTDGSKSTDYCSNCFNLGQFTQPNITLEQMKERVKEKMRKMHIPGFLANYFTKDIPNLKRWAFK